MRKHTQITQKDHTDTLLKDYEYILVAFQKKNFCVFK